MYLYNRLIILYVYIWLLIFGEILYMNIFELEGIEYILLNLGIFLIMLGVWYEVIFEFWKL